MNFEFPGASESIILRRRHYLPLLVAVVAVAMVFPPLAPMLEHI